MDPEAIMLSETNQRKTNAIWFHLHVESKKQNKWAKKQRDKQKPKTVKYRENEWMNEWMNKANWFIATGKGDGRMDEVDKRD